MLPAGASSASRLQVPRRCRTTDFFRCVRDMPPAGASSAPWPQVPQRCRTTDFFRCVGDMPPAGASSAPWPQVPQRCRTADFFRCVGDVPPVGASSAPQPQVPQRCRTADFFRCVSDMLPVGASSASRPQVPQRCQTADFFRSFLHILWEKWLNPWESSESPYRRNVVQVGLCREYSREEMNILGVLSVAQTELLPPVPGRRASPRLRLSLSGSCISCFRIKGKKQAPFGKAEMKEGFVSQGGLRFALETIPKFQCRKPQVFFYPAHMWITEGRGQKEEGHLAHSLAPEASRESGKVLSSHAEDGRETRGIGEPRVGHGCVEDRGLAGRGHAVNGLPAVGVRAPCSIPDVLNTPATSPVPLAETWPVLSCLSLLPLS
ncbi:uncharacterized protein [Symphalangus syndactylus]|uniref:uncharacterized protein n=1 Tax=Symphalangus syndactylus TaxID=9590 RepID=UPI003005A215